MTQPTSPTIQDRLLSAFRALVRAELPQYRYAFLYEYEILSTDGTTITCTPSDKTITLPDLTKVPLRTGAFGATVTLPQESVGKKCVVAFLNADPTRPVCLDVEPLPNAAAVARVGDTVTISAAEFAAATPTANLSTGAVTTLHAMQGAISSGSSVVSSP